MSDGNVHVEILVVQDDPAEALLMHAEFDDHRLVNRVHVAHDVRRALAHLAAGPPIPDVVLLDVNLPGRDGREVLRHLRSRADTRNVPVVLLTDSPVAERILRTEMLPVQGYAAKPVDFPCLVSVVRSLEVLGFEVWRPTG
ncbi:response regulator [Actinoplanes sp. DH11]|uniref:response regulator n=1 Tax=Actinoplanes sp. DH11 TaxID=2857011 RepID=UPI001E39B1B6|nr:response regulator [Actinoplanes sp. DH11]